MNNLFKKTICTIGILVCSLLFAQAQIYPIDDVTPKYTSVQKDSVSRTILEYIKNDLVRIYFNPPKEMYNLYTDFRYTSPSRKEDSAYFGSYQYAVTNKDSSIVIAIWTIDTYTPRKNQKLFEQLTSTLNQGKKRPTQWEASIKHNPKPGTQATIYPERISKKFNADRAAEYYMDCDVIKDKYYFGKSVLLDKEGRGAIYIDFLYSKGNEKKVKKMSEKCYKIIGFK